MQRVRIIQFSFFFAGVVLLVKSAQLQLFNSNLKDQASRTTLYKKTIYPARGLIYDRNGLLMVTNEPIYDLEVIYNEIDRDMDVSLFCELLEIDKETFEENIEKDWRMAQYNKSVPFTFLSKIEPHIFGRFQELLHLFPGFYPVLKNVRAYPHENAAHVLGYIGEIGKRELEQNKKIYASGDYIGVSGIEKTYEPLLRGSKGVEYVLKDNLGRRVGRLAEGKMDTSATSGQDLVSSIDLELQQFAEHLMRNKRGSVVAIEPKTGEILTMLSAPAYDPNVLSVKKNRGESFTALLSDTINRPFMDRSVMAKYPPGSIFKPVLALIALEEGILTPNRRMSCNGRYIVNKRSGFSQGCRNHPTPYNVQTALQWSCNSYFFQTVRDLLEKEGVNNPGVGLDILVDHLNKFGIGRRLGLDNLFENKGFVPNSEYYDELYSSVYNGWRSTYVLSLGIGQGELELTTLQMANLASIIANRGYYVIPHLLKTFKESEKAVSEKYEEKHYVDIKAEHFPPVVDGMERVVREGTARFANVDGLSICGKTGTSQNPHGNDHSVFFAFAPKDDPQIAIAVYVENAGGGSTLAAPIGSLLIQKHLEGEISVARKWVENYVLSKDLLSIP